MVPLAEGAEDFFRDKSVEWSVGNVPLLALIPTVVVIFAVWFAIKTFRETEGAWNKLGALIGVAIIGSIFLYLTGSGFSEAQSLCRQRWGDELTDPSAFTASATPVDDAAGDSSYSLSNCRTITGNS